MNVLAFDTCFAACSVAVRVGRSDAESRDHSQHRMIETGHAEALLPMIRQVMSDAGIAFRNLDLIVVPHGPGTFTGLRTGIAAARAMALATSKPVVSVSSLWPIGVRAVERLVRNGAKSDGVLVAMDARKGLVFVQAVDRNRAELTAPQLLPAANAALLCPNRPLLAVGTGATQVAAAARAAGRAIETELDDGQMAAHHQPDAGALLEAAGRPPCRGPVRPLYLREPDAKPQADKSLPWSGT